MVRLQRVTFLALHNYLGLTNELFSHVSVGGSLLENVFFSLDPPQKGGRPLIHALLTCPPCRRCSRCASSRSPATPPAPAPCATASGGSAPPRRAGKGKRSWVGAGMGRTDPPLTLPARPSRSRRPLTAVSSRSRAAESRSPGCPRAAAAEPLHLHASGYLRWVGGWRKEGGGPWGCESPPWGRASCSGLLHPPQGSCTPPKDRAAPPEDYAPPARVLKPPQGSYVPLWAHADPPALLQPPWPCIIPPFPASQSPPVLPARCPGAPSPK